MGFYDTQGTIDDNTLIIDHTYSYNFDYMEYGNWGAPIPSWTATTCSEWKNGWDIEIGGLFPGMSKNTFWNKLLNLHPDGCDEIVNRWDCDF